MHMFLLSKAPDTTFFEFLRLKPTPGKSTAMTLDTIRAMYQGEDKMGMLSKLIEIQTKALSELFFERLRGTGAVELARERLPKDLKSLGFDMSTKWFLGPLRNPHPKQMCLENRKIHIT